jgi:predicted kinase
MSPARPPERQALVVQMHGEPGSGKSTLALALGPRLGVVVLDKDVIKAALLRDGIGESAAGPAAYEAFFDLAGSLVAQGHSVILDNPVFWPRVEERWLALARDAGSPVLLVECVCTDREELLRRLATRDVVASQMRAPLDLSRDPGSAPTAVQPRLVVDTTWPLATLAAEAEAYIRAAAAAGGARPLTPVSP